MASPSNWLSCQWGTAQAQEALPKSASFYERLQRVSIREVPTDMSSVVLNLRGRVLDETGAPVANAVVALSNYLLLRTPQAQENLPQPSDFIARTLTNAQGEYSFAGLRCPVSKEEPVVSRNRALHVANVIVADQSGRMNWAAVEAEVPLAQTIESTADIKLANAHELSGVILDPQEQPLPNVSLRLESLIEFSEQRPPRFLQLCPELNLETLTDGDGRFWFPQLPAGLLANLELQHSDYMLTVGQVLTSPNAVRPSSNYGSPASEPVQFSPATWHLDQRLMVRGKIVNRKNEPLAGAVIRRIFPDGYTRSEADGRFAIPISANGMQRPFKAAAISPFYLEWPEDSPYMMSRPILSTESLAAGNEITIVAEDTIMLRGQVLASNDHQPVPNVPLRIAALKRIWPHIRMTSLTDAEGRFAVPVIEGRYVVTCGPMEGFDLLAANTQNGPVTGINPQTQRIVDLVADRPPSDLTIVIDRTPPVVVHVVDNEGKAIVGAMVKFLKSNVSLRMSGQATVQDLVPDGITDAEGNCEFRLPTLFNETWIVTGSSPAEAPRIFGSVQVRSEREAVELVLVPGLPVRGRVLLDGKPLAKISVRIEKGFPAREENPSSWLSTVETNDAGEYELLIPTSKRVVPQNRFGSAIVRLVALPEFTQCDHTSERLNLKMNGTLEDDTRAKDFEVFTATGEASGIIVDKYGKPVAGAIVRAGWMFADAKKQGIATTDQSGNFRWIGLGPGKFHPIISIDGKTHRPEITIEAGQEGVTIEVPRE